MNEGKPKDEVPQAPVEPQTEVASAWMNGWRLPKDGRINKEALYLVDHLPPGVPAKQYEPKLPKTA